MLNPNENGFVAGILHRNHLAMIERGPWSFARIRPPIFETVNDSDAAGGTVEVQRVSGTCDCCSSPIKDVAEFVSSAGERISLGISCAETFRKHLAKGAGLKLDAGVKALRKVKAAAAKVRKLARCVKTNAALLGALRAAVDGFEVGTFERRFCRDLCLRIERDGKAPSPKQLALFERLCSAAC